MTKFFFENDKKIRRFLWSSNVENVRLKFKNVEFESDELTFSGTRKLEKHKNYVCVYDLFHNHISKDQIVLTF